MVHLCSEQMKTSPAGNASEIKGNHVWYLQGENKLYINLINCCWIYCRIFHKLGLLPPLLCTQIISSDLGSNCWAVSTNNRHTHQPWFILQKTCSNNRSTLLHVRFHSFATRFIPGLDICGVHSLVGKVWSSLDWSTSWVWPVTWRHGQGWKVTWSCHQHWRQGFVSAFAGSTGCSTNMENTSFPVSFGKSLVW